MSISPMPGATQPTTTGAAGTPGANYSGTGAVKPLATPSSTVPLPSTLSSASSQVPSQPNPIYRGPHIGSIAHLADSFGANYNFDHSTGMAKVNNTTIRPTSILGGIPLGFAHQIAMASGVPQSNIQQSGNTTTVMPHAEAPTQAVDANSPYWQGVVKQGGAYRDPTAYGETIDQAKQHEAQLYGIDPSQVQVTKGGHTFVPAQYVQAWLNRQAQANQPQPVDPMQQLGQGYLSGIAGSMPQAPQLPQMPTFDPNQVLSQFQQIQPFQWDAAQNFMDQYNSQMPAFQQQMATADQKANESLNARGIFNSGIAEQDVNSINQGLYGKLLDSIQKGTLAQQKQDFTQWLGQANLVNKQNQDFANYALNSYKANLDAAYKAGQLSNQQYADQINEWGKMVSFTQAAMNNQAKEILNQQQDAFNWQKAMIPYNYGPTPYQQGQLNMQQLKTMAPWMFGPTPYQQGQLNLGNAKLSAQVQQWQAQDAMDQEKISGYLMNGQPTLARQQFDNTVANDAAKIQEAMMGISDARTRIQLQGLQSELNSLNAPIQAAIAAKDTASVTQLMNQRKAITDSIDSIVNTMGTDGTDTSYTPGSPLVTPNSPQ